jgi:hypothetical protein
MSQSRNMDRLGRLEPSSLVREQKKLYDDIVQYFHVKYVAVLMHNTCIYRL